MAIESQQKEINGRTYEVTQLPAMKALALSIALGKAVGPAIALSIALGKAVGPALAAGMDADVSRAAELLFSGITETSGVDLIKRLLETVTVCTPTERRPMLKGFDVEYAGAGLVDVIEVVRFALEVQFGPTFAALIAAAAGNAKAAVPAAASN